MESDKTLTYAISEKLETVNVLPVTRKNNGMESVAIKRKVKHRSHKLSLPLPITIDSPKTHVQELADSGQHVMVLPRRVPPLKPQDSGVSEDGDGCIYPNTRM